MCLWLLSLLHLFADLVYEFQLRRAHVRCVQYISDGFAVMLQHRRTCTGTSTHIATTYGCTSSPSYTVVCKVSASLPMHCSVSSVCAVVVARVPMMLRSRNMTTRSVNIKAISVVLSCLIIGLAKSARFDVRIIDVFFVLFCMRLCAREGHHARWFAG